jgi:Cu/Ag efflux pump CusA
VTDDIRAKIEKTGLPLTVDFGQVIGDMLGDLMSSVQPIEIKIFGTDQKTIEDYSKKVADMVSKVNGTADVFDGIVLQDHPYKYQIFLLWGNTILRQPIFNIRCKLYWKEM